MKHLITFLIISLSLLSHMYGQDSTHLDLSDQLFYYGDNGEKIPIEAILIHKSVHLDVNQLNISKGTVKILVPSQTTLLFNNKVERITSNNEEISISYSKTISKISLYNTKGLGNIKAWLLLPGSGLNKEIEIINRKDDIATNFIMVVSMIVLLLYAYNKKRSNELFNNHFKMIRALTIKTISETLFKIRILEKSNLLLLVAHSMGIALIIISLINWQPIDSTIGRWFEYHHFWEAMGLWILLSATIFAALILKSALILSFATIFKLKSFARVHYYTHLRITLLIHILVYLLILIFNYQFPDVEVLKLTVNLALSLMILRIIIIFIKLMNLQSLRKVYLFSYLCATEILPYIILVKITYL